MSVTYHTPTATGTTPAFSGTATWSYSDPDAQTKFHVDIATSSAFGASIVSTSGDIASSAKAWRIPATNLADDTRYWYQVKVFDGTSWGAFSPPAQFTYDAYLRGEEAYYEAVPFDLTGGLRLDIGVHNGEARLSRDLFSIPSFGPPGELSLTYSSLEPSTAGGFGTGWSSNLGQYLTFEPANGLVVWHRPDGGRVAFSGSGSSWTVVGGHYETLGYDAVALTYTVTAKDQTKLVFASAAPGRLVRIQNRFGKALSFAWTASSLTATDASGRQTALTIDGASHVTRATDSAGRTWDFAYTGADLTTLTETDPDKVPGGTDGPLLAPVTTFGYDASHHLTTISRQRLKAAGGFDTITWTIGYTGGHATSVLDPIGAATTGTPAHTFTYATGSTVAGLLRTYPSPVVRNTSTYTLDGFGRPTAILDRVPRATRRRRPSIRRATSSRSPGRSPARPRPRRPIRTTPRQRADRDRPARRHSVGHHGHELQRDERSADPLGGGRRHGGQHDHPQHVRCGRSSHEGRHELHDQRHDAPDPGLGLHRQWSAGRLDEPDHLVPLHRQ